jgi:pSer/pThr/pTyr-binding forkhead associated (FHA) protein
MTPRLLARREDGSLRAVMIREVARIGTAAGNEVVVADASVLPLHARVGVTEGAIWIEDAGSPSGTRVNGERVSRGTLRHLDVVTVGDGVHLVFLQNDVAGSATRVVPASASGPPIGIGGATTQERHQPGERAIMGVKLVGPTGVFESSQRLCTVGRRDATFRIDSKDVSRKHAVIAVTPAGVTIEDLSSANGTRVNGSAISGRVPLADGDRVAFATFTFVVTFVRSDRGA